MSFSGAGSIFAPDEVGHLKRAFDRGWLALKFAFPNDDSQEAHAVREALAQRIVEIAQSGETNPVKLSNRALSSTPPYAARWGRDA